jgi:hypothetical protein
MDIKADRTGLRRFAMRDKDAGQGRSTAGQAGRRVAQNETRKELRTANAELRTVSENQPVFAGVQLGRVDAGHVLQLGD